MAITKNLNVDQGSSFTDSVYYVSVKSPTSLAGYNLRAQMRRSHYSANAISFITSTEHAANGNILLSLESTITANISPGRYVYDAEAYIGNIVIRIAEGIVTVNPGVTR
jgi:hypothetical protein